LRSACALRLRGAFIKRCHLCIPVCGECFRRYWKSLFRSIGCRDPFILGGWHEVSLMATAGGAARSFCSARGRNWPDPEATLAIRRVRLLGYSCRANLWPAGLSLTQAVRKLDLIWSYGPPEDGFSRFFALRATTGLKIRGAFIPRRVFTQPGPGADAPVSPVWPMKANNEL
jgi:hypothetical protein